MTYSANNITPYPLEMTHGKGVYLTDSQGNSYLDMISGISVLNFGHQHPKLVKALTTQLNQVAIVPRLFHTQALTKLLESACKLCSMDKALPMNSGAEAVETAIKTVRKWAYTIKSVPNNQAEIIICDNSFHGRTVTTVSASTTEQYKKHFGPLTLGFQSIPFNDTQALEQAITSNTAAFIVEPIQGEAGVILPDSDYLTTCAAICKKNNVLLILDEIQTGMGRTGKALAGMHEDVNPDGILLGKALGGGILPISLFLAKQCVMDALKPGDHGSTFGGNPLACAVANEAINLLSEEKLPENAALLGSYFMSELKKMNLPPIKEVRGKGLLLSIELDHHLLSAKEAFEKLKDQGLLCMITRNNTIRLLPPLTITKEQIDTALHIVQNTLIQHGETTHA